MARPLSSSTPVHSMNVLHAFLLMQPTPGSNPMFGFAFQIVLIIAIFYFILLRPQQKQRKEQEQSLREIKKGDEVVTAGGIIGDVIFIKQGTKDGEAVVTMEDRITISRDSALLIVMRSSIVTTASPSFVPCLMKITSPMMPPAVTTSSPFLISRRLCSCSFRCFCWGRRRMK